MTAKSNLLVVALLQVTLLQPSSAADKKPDECGLASVYSSASEETASGEDTRAEDFTAAHRTLPFGTLVRVENKKNGRSAVVRITDRGPTISGRIVDVSQVAARELGISGLAQVCLKILSVPESRAAEDH
jgi:rare lipoprotein A